MRGGLGTFLAELRRRKVYQVAAAYLAVGVAISVSAPDLFSAFALPTAAARFVVLVLVLGFPVALVLAWAYEVKPEEPAEPDQSGDSVASTAAPAAALHVSRFEPSPDDPRPSLAVLPFASFSDEAEADYFGLGVMEDILMRLARVRGIRLVSRTSVMHYRASEKTTREIARELGVRTVLEGSIRRSGDRVRIVAQLIDGVSDEHLWADTYDRDLKDVFRVQTDVAESIATALRAELTEAERAGVRNVPTENLAAWGLYLRAMKTFQSLRASDMHAAEGWLREVIRLDPEFAPAWGMLAQLLTLAGLVLPQRPLELVPKIRAAVVRALALDPRCVQGHAAHGVVKLFHDWEPQEAEAALDRALALDPDDPATLYWKALLLVFTGRKVEAIAAVRRGLSSDPLSLIGHTTLGQVLAFSERFDEAVQSLEAAVGLWPSAPHLHHWLGLVHSMADRPQEALGHFVAAAEHGGSSPQSDAYQITALALVGRREDATVLLSELQARSAREYVDPYLLFMGSLYVEGFEAAASYIDDMVEARSFYLPYLLSSPRFRPLLADRRLRDLADRVFPGVAPGV